MVTLDKVSAVGKLSDCLAISQSSVGREHKVDVVGEEASICMNRAPSRSVNQNKSMRSDLYLDSNYCKPDSRPLGVIGAQNESSLFSSSLSDLVHHKLKLPSSRLLPRHSSAVVPHNDEVEPLTSLEECEEQGINNLPDEDDLFDGIGDGMEKLGHGSGGDDLEEFDVFFGSGGIELGGDEHQLAGQRNAGYPWGLHQNQQHSANIIDHVSRIHAPQRLPTRSMVGDASPHESSRPFNGFHSPVRMPSIASELGRLEASQPFPRPQLENRGLLNFHPHPQISLQPNVLNSIPQHSFDNLVGIVEDVRSKASEKVKADIRRLGLNGQAMELNEGVFGYSHNGVHIPMSLASKANSYQQQHHLRSLLVPNSPSLLNNNNEHHLGRLPGSPGTPHLMMNMASPVHHHLQVGSAPVVKVSLWDRQQMYTGESHESPGFQMGALRSMGIPGFSPSRPREISSHGNFSHATEVSKNVVLHSPQQISHMFHERNSLNSMNSLPTSFGSPSERVRTRRNDSSMSHADRKHYELNVDRISRGDDRRTTLMIKNIPNKYTSKMLLATIDEHHRGKYDFIYLPIDFKNKCNMGYAFINMIDPIQIVSFHQTFEGRKWEKFNSEKVASLAYARIQGKGSLIAHFQNSSLMNEDKRCRPILFHTDGPNAGDQEPFPMGSTFRSKSGRQQSVGGEDDE